MELPAPNLEDLFGNYDRFAVAIGQLKNQGASQSDDDYAEMLTIYFELPFQVPWPDRPITIVFGDTYIILLLTPKKRQLEDFHGFATERTITGVTIAGPAIPPEQLTEANMNRLIDFGLDYLNGFLLSYSLVTKDGMIGPVTLPMLSPMSMWGHVRPFDRTAAVQGTLFLNPHGVTYDKDPLPDEIGAAVIGMATLITGPGYPFLTSWQLRIEGEHQVWMGRYHIGVLLLASAFEARIDELLRYFFWKEGKSRADFEAMLSQHRFGRRLTSQLHPRIGGIFDLKRPGVVKHWHTRTHLLRHKIVHGGYRPNRQEAVHARWAMIQAWDYVMGLLRERAKDYPEIAPFIGLMGEKFIWPITLSGQSRETAIEALGPVHSDVRGPGTPPVKQP